MGSTLITLSLLICSAGADPSWSALEKNFADPPRAYSPVPIWWWSGDKVVPEQITKQLEQLAAGGIYNVMVMNLAPSGPLYGSAADDPPFLSEEWWALFEHALKECKRLGMQLWFYDQLGFSGAGLQARVVRDHPDYRATDLQRVVQDVEGAGTVELATPPGGTALSAFVAMLASDEKERTAPRWIWDPDMMMAACLRYFRGTFELAAAPKEASVTITCDNGYVLYVNGQEVGSESIPAQPGWGTAEEYDVTALLVAGKNVVAVRGENKVGNAGLLLDTTVDGESVLASGTGFVYHAEELAGWNTLEFDASTWKPALVVAEYPGVQWGPVLNFGYGQHRMGTPINAVQEVTAQIQDGNLKINVPEGRHRVMMFYTVPVGFDYQNPDAGAALLDILHGEIERRFQAELGKGIAGSFQDEFPALPRYSTRLFDEFERREGYDLRSRLAALYDDVTDRFGDASGPTTAQIRCAATDVASALCEEAFFVPLQRWHDQYGMLCGYDQTVRNADPIRGEQYYLDYFRTMRHYSVPGSDMDGDAKPHQSMADLYGTPRVWIEAFHSSGWGQTLEEVATLLHPWLANGATLYNPHAVYYSIHGSYWEWAPPDTGWRQPYFRENKRFADYTSRLCYLLSKGEHVVQTAILHPSATVHASTGFGSSGTAAQDASSLYWGLQRVLQAAHVDYIILDEDSLTRARVTKGRLQIRDVELTTVVLPAARVLRGASARVLREFAVKGGQVVIAGGAPEECADRGEPEAAFRQQIDALLGEAQTIQTPEEITGLLGRLDPPTSEGLLALQREVNDRNVFLLLSDTETAAEGQARFAINDRELWKTAAAEGKTLNATLSGDGLPVLWDASSGETRPLLNFSRNGEQGRTFVRVPLERTPAPVVVLKQATRKDPISIESNAQVTRVSRTGRQLEAEVLPWNLKPVEGDAHLRAVYADAAFKGAQPAPAVEEVTLEPPFSVRLLPTADNADGSFAWPPSPGPIPVEIRNFRYRAETPGEDASQWAAAALDDSTWEMAYASFGARAQWWGPLPVPAGGTFESLAPAAPEGVAGTPAVYSLKLGINEDPVYSGALGGKGRIPEEFLSLGDVPAGAPYLVRATVIVPRDAAATGPLRALLRIGGSAQKRAFVNGKEVAFADPLNARVRSAEVDLAPGENTVELLASLESAGPLRLFYQFLPPGSVLPYPEWIWSSSAPASGKTIFRKTFTLPAAPEKAGMVVALGDIHQIYVNGRLVADQGNFDPYFTSRAEHYDIVAALKADENIIEIKARDTGGATGFLLDGAAWMPGGDQVVFVSGPEFTCQAEGGTESTPVRLLPAPAHGYMGDPALLQLQPRPHPLPFAGWLVDQPAPPAPFDQLVYAAANAAPPEAWFRFRVPPGATGMTLDTPGNVQVWVNGEPATAVKETVAWEIDLPQPESPARTAAVRIEAPVGYAGGAAITRPITFAMGPGSLPLGSWDELGLPHYAGGVVYDVKCNVTAPKPCVLLDLGHVRGTAEVTVNGKPCGVRLWHPYRFDIADALQAGDNQIEITIFNTLGPHFAEGHPAKHVYKNHTKSGIFGPVTIRSAEPVKFSLSAR